MTLPKPTRSRWQPLRAGLVDLFYYDTEEFWFHDGRLLLRGNNGTGKSKVLALMLPFLLDGDLSPHRVEPDADSKKRMEWNLLLGGGHPNRERTGYTWLEFGRLDETGTEHFLTLGCGLKAVAGRGIARHWFFITRSRPGADLALVDATGSVLSRDRLVQTLDGVGVVHDTARAYRRAVDEALFGLGDHRYAALVDLLVQLRQPQLSKRPSERALSGALTESLPPLDQAVIADVAEAFRALEEDREALRDLIDAERSARTFLGHYRRYAQAATRRRAERPRLAQSEYERATESVRAADREEAEADRALAEATARLETLQSEAARLAARQEALREAPEMRDARRLDQLATEVSSRRADRDSRLGDAERTAARQQKAQDALALSQLQLADASTLRDESVSQTDNLARKLGVGTEHEQKVTLALQAEPSLDVQLLRAEATRLAERRETAIAHVERAHRAVQDADQFARLRWESLENLQREVGPLAESRATADDERARAADALRQARAGHVASLVELHLGDPATLDAAQEQWVETLDGPDPGQVAVDAADVVAAQAIAGARVAVQERIRQVEDLIGELYAEQERLRAGTVDGPPAPRTRDLAARQGRAGGPLWYLIDFAPDLPAAGRAGLEAALEASGVLDAWLCPDGDLLASLTDDVLLAAENRTGPGLTGLLRAADGPDPAVPAAAVEQVLRAISLGPPEASGEGESTWVGVDGAFGIGVLRGHWHKPEAVHIGAAAREEARRRRLSELEVELSTAASQLAGHRGELAELDRRDAVRTAERGGLPSDRALQAAHREAVRLAQELTTLQTRIAHAQQQHAEALAAAAAAASTLTEVAADVRLPVGQDELAAVRVALHDYQLELRTLWPAITQARTAQQHHEQRRAEEAVLSQDVDRANAAASAASRNLDAVEEVERTLRGSVGQAVETLLRQLAEVAEQVSANDQAVDQSRTSETAARVAQGQAQRSREERGKSLEAAAEERRVAAGAFQRFAGTGLIGVALPGQALPEGNDDWAPDPTMRLARAIERQLADDLGGAVPDDAAWAAVQRRVNEEFKNLTDSLFSQGSSAAAQVLEDGIVVEIVFWGRSASVPELVDRLAVEVAERGRVLDEREREVLENHLVNEVASTLQELMVAAERQVQRMNNELQERPTSTGMRLRMRWIPQEDGPAGLAEARQRLLRQTADAWSEADRTAVGGFLQARIAEIRAASPAGTWLEHLTEALDYRAWNRFVIERFQNEQWRSATGPASGGERVLAASVPLFAAASSHYASAGNVHAPRLVMLDEAFAGVDDNARAKYLGLLAAFDLDVVMTSEREWGCYPEVPGLAIAQLSRVDGIDAVLVTNWQWDGVARVRAQRPADVSADVSVDVRVAVPDDAAEIAHQAGLFDAL